MKGAAVEQILRDVLASALDEALREALDRALLDVRGRVFQVGGETVIWPPPGVEPRTPRQQAEARRIAYEESLAYTHAHSGDYLRKARGFALKEAS